MIVNKQNGNVCFNEEEHKYWNNENGKKAISCTQLIENYKNPYDVEFWSLYKALERQLNPAHFKLERSKLLELQKIDLGYFLTAYNLNELDVLEEQQNIKDEWDLTNKVSTDRGKVIHSKLENSFYESPECKLEKFGLGGTFNVQKDYYELDVEKGVYPEYLVFYEDKDILIAGQLDLLVKDFDDLYIFDWKGFPLDTPILTTTGWTTIGKLNKGALVYDRYGKPVKVIAKSKIHYNPCYKITFHNGESVVCDEDHKWVVEDQKGKEYILTTKKIYKKLHSWFNFKQYRIKNTKPLNNKTATLGNDPFQYGLQIAEIDWKIPSQYFISAEEQRLWLLTGIIRQYGVYVPDEHIYIIKNVSYLNDLITLVASLGMTPYISNNDIYFTAEWSDVDFKGEYRDIVSIERHEEVPTQCIEVTGESHTYLIGKSLIPTHNTNKEIKKTSFYNNKTKKYTMMKYPLNNIMDCNLMHYTLQLSLYGWMLQQINPQLVIKRLTIVHYDHAGNVTPYTIDYLESDVKKMINDYKKQMKRNEQKERRTRFQY